MLPQTLRGPRLCQNQADPSPRLQLPHGRCQAARRRRDHRSVVAVFADNAASVAGDALTGLTLRGAPPKTWCALNFIIFALTYFLLFNCTEPSWSFFPYIHLPTYLSALQGGRLLLAAATG